MQINEHRRLAKEARAIVEETRRRAEELRRCVADSRRLIGKSKQILAQSNAARVRPPTSSATHPDQDTGGANLGHGELAHDRSELDQATTRDEYVDLGLSSSRNPSSSHASK